MRPVPIRQLLLATLILARRSDIASAARALATYITQQHARRRWPIIRGALETMKQQQQTVCLELAHRPTEPTLESLHARLTQEWSDSSLEIRDNPALLGGFRLHVGAKTFDYSLTTRLQQVKKVLEATDD